MNTQLLQVLIIIKQMPGPVSSACKVKLVTNYEKRSWSILRSSQGRVGLVSVGSLNAFCAFQWSPSCFKKPKKKKSNGIYLLRKIKRTQISTLKFTHWSLVHTLRLWKYFMIERLNFEELASSLVKISRIALMMVSCCPSTCIASLRLKTWSIMVPFWSEHFRLHRPNNLCMHSSD